MMPNSNVLFPPVFSVYVILKVTNNGYLTPAFTTASAFFFFHVDFLFSAQGLRDKAV